MIVSGKAHGMHGILAILQKLNYNEIIYKMLNNFEMSEFLHYFPEILRQISRRVAGA